MIIAALPFLVICIVFFGLRYKYTKIDFQKRLEYLAVSTSEQLTNVINDMIFISSDIIGRNDFLTNAKVLDLGIGSAFDLQESYFSLSTDVKAFEQIKSNYQIIWFNNRGNYINSKNKDFDSNSYRTTIDGSLIASLEWKELVDSRRGAVTILPISSDDFFSIENDAIAIIRSVRVPTGIVGYLVVMASVSDLGYIFDNSVQFETGVRILSPEGQILIQNDAFPLSSDDGFSGGSYFESEGRKYMVSVFTDPNRRLVTIMAKPSKSVFASFSDELVMLFLLVLILLLLMILCIAFFSRRLSVPLVNLKKRMQGITIDNLKVQNAEVFKYSYDEINALNESFLEMQGRLNSMVQKEILYNKMQAEENFHSLQSQINPHFIYNTLNAISIIAQEGSSENVSDACLKLSSIIRYTSSQSKEEATLLDEMEYAQAYLGLMQLRYGDRFMYIFSVDPSLEEMAVPRLSIQPFLENIFEHASDLTHRKIHILFSAEKVASGWELQVVDDGRGFTPGVLSSLLEKTVLITSNQIRELRKQPISGGIGIVNTIARMRLFWGDAFSFEIGDGAVSGVHILLRIKNHIEEMK